jgi:hypothetical protein
MAPSSRAHEERPRGSVKGTVLTSRLAFVRDRGGEAAAERVIARLPPEDQEVLGGIVLAVGWYPFETNERLDAAIAAEFGRGDSIYRELGAQSAIDSFKNTQKNLARSRDAHALLKQTAQIHRLFKSTGSMSYEQVAPTRATLRTVDCDGFSRADCLTNLGWLEKALELVGVRASRVIEIACRARGDKACEYRCEWAEPPPPAPDSKKRGTLG